MAAALESSCCSEWNRRQEDGSWEDHRPCDLQGLGQAEALWQSKAF